MDGEQDCGSKVEEGPGEGKRTLATIWVRVGNKAIPIARHKVGHLGVLAGCRNADVGDDVSDLDEMSDADGV